jgi:hypothetical protein
VSSLNPGGGSRAEASIKSAAKLIEQALANWTAVPALPTLL